LTTDNIILRTILTKHLTTVTRGKITGSKKLNAFYVNIYKEFKVSFEYEHYWDLLPRHLRCAVIYTSIANANRSLCKESNSSKRTILSFLRHKQHWWWISF